ncbi:MAG: lysophospholipid acyltransferase family protein, partial [Candidatus Hydrogenedentota bacterium]
ASVFAFIFDHSGNSSHKVNRLWAKIIMWFSGCRVEVIDKENLISDSGQILVANHQSGFDIFVLTAYIPLQIRWLAKESLFRIPFMGWAMFAARYISIDRQNARKAIVSLKQAIDTVAKGASVVVFPEGTRTLTGKLQGFKKGTLYIATKGRFPIVPITIIGTYDIMKKGSFRLFPQPIKIIIDKPILYSEIENKNEDYVLETLRNLILSNLSSQ